MFSTKCLASLTPWPIYAFPKTLSVHSVHHNIMDSVMVVTCKAHFKTSRLFSDLFDSAWIWTDEKIQHISWKWNSTFSVTRFWQEKLSKSKKKKHFALAPQFCPPHARLNSTMQWVKVFQHAVFEVIYRLSDLGLDASLRVEFAGWVQLGGQFDARTHCSTLTSQPCTTICPPPGGRSS